MARDSGGGSGPSAPKECCLTKSCSKRKRERERERERERTKQRNKELGGPGGGGLQASPGSRGSSVPFKLRRPWPANLELGAKERGQQKNKHITLHVTLSSAQGLASGPQEPPERKEPQFSKYALV